MNCVEEVLIDEVALDFFNLRVDELADERDIEGTRDFIAQFDLFIPVFNADAIEAGFHYMLGNAYSLLYVPQNEKWYSPDLNKTVIHLRKAYNLIKDDIYNIELASRISTNLGNYLSQQGRFMCARKFWKYSISLNNQPIAHTSLYQSEMYIAHFLNHDKERKSYHYYLAYQHLQDRLELPNDPYIFNDSDLIFNSEEVREFKRDIESGKAGVGACPPFKIRKKSAIEDEEQAYLAWCGDNCLFLDELEVGDVRYSTHPDSLFLPPITAQINMSLSHHEELIYHTNFEEIKNDFCYARYLIFTAINTDSEEQSFFNRTFEKIDDLTYCIDNIKAQNLKTAFRVLYSLLDKIAYFINRFYKLNDAGKDRRINFESLFKKLNAKKWEPHPKLLDSKNHFLHALFYILKDLRDIDDHESVSDLLNPDIAKIYEIRNFIEHRSFKIINSLGADLVFADSQRWVVDDYNKTLKESRDELDRLSALISDAKETKERDKLLNKQKGLREDIAEIGEKLKEKKALSQHTLIITDSDFIDQVMTLAELIRSSIIYLSFSISFEEACKPSRDERYEWRRGIPLK